MTDFFEKVTSQVDPFKKLIGYIPGFGGYVERQNRRDADKLVRDTVTFIDRVTMASCGYSGLFDAIKINEKELEALYQYDLAFFELADQVKGAVDNLEATLTDEAGLPAAIRNLTSLARLAIETFDRRSEAFTGSGK